MPVFSQTLWHEYVWKKMACFDLKHAYYWKKKFQHSSTLCVVWGINLKDQKENIFTFQICSFERLHCVLVLPCMRPADKGLNRARRVKWQTGGLGICFAHHYWEYESIGAVASANYNVTSGFTTGAGCIQDILHHALNNWKCGAQPWAYTSNL